MLQIVIAVLSEFLLDKFSLSLLIPKGTIVTISLCNLQTKERFLVFLSSDGNHAAGHDQVWHAMGTYCQIRL